jgi:hypothetical protein
MSSAITIDSVIWGPFFRPEKNLLFVLHYKQKQILRVAQDDIIPWKRTTLHQL